MIVKTTLKTILFHCRKAKVTLFTNSPFFYISFSNGHDVQRNDYFRLGWLYIYLYFMIFFFKFNTIDCVILQIFDFVLLLSLRNTILFFKIEY